MSFRKSPVPPGALEPKSTAQILNALNGIVPGEIVVYHRGDLASDRRGRGRLSEEIDEIGSRAFKLATDSIPRLCLIQYKQALGVYAYVAIGSRYSHPAIR